MLELVGFEQIGRPKAASNIPADCYLDRGLANPPAPAKVLNVKTYVLSSIFLSDRTFDRIYYGNTAQFPPYGLSTAPAAAARHLRCQNAR